MGGGGDERGEEGVCGGGEHGKYFNAVSLMDALPSSEAPGVAGKNTWTSNQVMATMRIASLSSSYPSPPPPFAV